MKIQVSCRDKYEAQKLSSLIYIKDSNERFITAILNVIENEIIVLLNDKSAHSVILKDVQNVEAFADFLQSVFEKKHRIVRTNTIDEKIEVVKE